MNALTIRRQRPSLAELVIDIVFISFSQSSLVSGFLLWYCSSYLRSSEIAPLLGSGRPSCSAGRLTRPFTLACLTARQSSASSSLRASLSVLLLLAAGGSSLVLLALSEKLGVRSLRAIFLICECVSFFLRMAKISVSYFSLGSALLASRAAISRAKTEGNLRSLFSLSSSLPPGGMFSFSSRTHCCCCWLCELRLCCGGRLRGWSGSDSLRKWSFLGLQGEQLLLCCCAGLRWVSASAQMQSLSSQRLEAARVSSPRWSSQRPSEPQRGRSILL